MASVMKRVVENGGDAQIVFAAILEIARNILREGGFSLPKMSRLSCSPKITVAKCCGRRAATPPARRTRNSYILRCRVRSSTEWGNR